MRFPFACLLTILCASAQTFSTKWEELTGPDFQKAIAKAQNTCLLPFGIIEKHGPHLPLGTDLINVRYASLQGARSCRYAAACIDMNRAHVTLIGSRAGLGCRSRP